MYARKHTQARTNMYTRTALLAAAAGAMQRQRRRQVGIERQYNGDDIDLHCSVEQKRVAMRIAPQQKPVAMHRNFATYSNLTTFTDGQV